MSSTNLQKTLEKLEKNPYYDKYAQRIAELQRTSPEEFLQRVEQTGDPPARPAPLASVDTRSAPPPRRTPREPRLTPPNCSHLLSDNSHLY